MEKKYILIGLAILITIADLLYYTSNCKDWKSRFNHLFGIIYMGLMAVLVNILVGIGVI